jgi:glycosyltransferase involved in cell wall biosynthesis
MKRICMVVHSDYVHDRRVKNQALALIDEGYHVTVLCTEIRSSSDQDFLEHLTIDGVECILHRFPPLQGKRRFYTMMRSYYKTLTSIDADIYHAHDLDTLIPTALIASKKRGKLIYDSHELYTESVHVAHRWFTKLVWRSIELLFISKVDEVITVCEGIAQELKERYRLEKKVHVVRNFSDPPVLKTASTPPEFESFVQNHPYTLLYQGYVHRGRGLDQALEALVGMPTWGLVICGDGTYRSNLEKKAVELHVDEQILFLGQLDHDQLFEVSKRCDLGLCMIEPVSLSYYYALPNKLIEYVQAGIPVVGSDLPEIRRLVNDYGLGFILKEDQYLKDLMLQIDTIRQNIKLNESIFNAAQSLNWSTEKHRLLEVYQSIS